MTPKLTPTEADREMAAKWAKSNSRHAQAANILRGSCDSAPLVQFFAQHAATARAEERAETQRLRDALVRIALSDRHTRRVNPNPDGGIRGPGGMIAVFALIGKNGSRVTDEELLKDLGL